MSMQDPISDLITCIRNGQSVKKDFIVVPSSNKKLNIVSVLKNEGYIFDYDVFVDWNGKKFLKVYLKYYKNKPVISVINRISRPGLKCYRGKYDIPKILGGLGIIIISTSSGIMTDKRARSAGLGGELICSVY